MARRKKSNSPSQTGVFIVENRVDLYLKRASYIAQSGLFVLTILTLFYTVIPLYQKSLLDEAIAKKELELKKVNAEFELIYDGYKMMSIAHLVRSVIDRCSPFSLRFEDKRLDENMHYPLSRYDTVACLTEYFYDSNPLFLLKIEDREAVLGKLPIINDRLKTLQKKLKRDISAIESLNIDDGSSLPPPGPGIAQYVEEARYNNAQLKSIGWSEVVAETELEKRIFESRVKEAIAQLDRAYNDDVVEEFISLNIDELQ